jgi:hypothetical protein
MYLTRKRRADAYGDPAASGFEAVAIKKVHVPGIYFDEPEVSVRVLASTAAPDVAVIELADGDERVLEGIPAATVDLRPVAVSEPLVIMGYGCEEGVYGPKDYSRQRLKFQQTRALGIESQQHEGSVIGDVQGEYARRLEKQYVFTPGQGGKSEEASLCPGDSGGPVYRDDGGQSLIVGVNAYYSFRPAAVDSAHVSVTNWHTRLDVDSRFDVGSWLASLGVNVAGDAHASHYGSCAPSRKTGRLACGAFAKTSADNGGEGAFGAPTKEARFERGDDGAWIWTQIFEGKQLSLTADGVVVEPLTPAGACRGKRDGHYCGDNFGDADPRALYRCAGGGVAERTVCELSCQGMPRGVPDRCRSEPPVDPCAKARAGDGRYCGKSIDGEVSALYQCRDGTTFKKVTCSKGCEPRPRGVPDRCAR